MILYLLLAIAFFQKGRGASGLHSHAERGNEVERGLQIPLEREEVLFSHYLNMDFIPYLSI